MASTTRKKATATKKPAKAKPRKPKMIDVRKLANALSASMERSGMPDEAHWVQHIYNMCVARAHNDHQRFMLELASVHTEISTAFAAEIEAIKRAALKGKKVPKKGKAAQREAQAAKDLLH